MVWANLITVRLQLSRTDRCSAPPLPRLPGATATALRHISILLAPHLPRAMLPFTVLPDGVHGAIAS